jgi:hypothetical protein
MKQYIILFAALLTAVCSFAQDWTGAVNSDWNNTANWSSTPSNGDNIVIDPANYTGAMASPIVTGTAAFTPAEMLVQNGAQLTIAGNLSASDRVEILGAGTVVTITSGTFALNGGGNNARLIFAEDAHLQLEDGSLNVGQRLLFELGGTGEVNGGTITVGETIALVDGSTNSPSRLTQNGGTITTNAEFGFENEAGDFFPVFEQTAGELHINGALIWLGAAPGSGRGYFRSTGGTVFVTGSISNDPTSTMGMHLELSGTALLENSGNAVQTLAGDSIVVVNGAKWSDIHTVAWQHAGVFHAESGGLFRSGNTTLTGTGSYQFDHLVVPPLKVLNHVTPASISVSGDLEVTGTFLHAANKLVLNGAAQQTVTASSSGLSLYDLEIRNSVSGQPNAYGITLNNDLHLSHNLHLLDGIVESVPTATIFLADNATTTGGGDTTFIDGFMEKAGNDTITFPVGAAPDRYRPLAVSAPVSAATVIRVNYNPVPYADLVPAETPLQSVSAIEYWDLSRSGSTDPVSVTAGWNDASQSGLTNCADISMTVWDGAQWVFVPSTTTGLCNGANAGTLASAGDLPLIGPVTIGFTANVYQQAVLVCSGESVTVGTHVYDTSGVYTDVLQDVNGDDSTVVTILTVHAPLSVAVSDNVTHISLISPNAVSYQWIDCGNGNIPVPGATASEFYPVANGSYAVIVSANGCSDTSACVVIDQLGLAGTTFVNALLYPNPVSGDGVVTVQAPTAIQSLQLYTADGRIVVIEQLQITGEKAAITLPALAPGTYFIALDDVNGSYGMQRLVVR